MTFLLELQVRAVESSLGASLSRVLSQLSDTPRSFDPALLQERVAEASAAIARVREEADHA